MNFVLGISAFYHDSAATLIKDGKIISAVQEERFTRIKHWAGFPSQSINYCLEEAGIKLEEVDFVAINSDPKANFWPKLKYVLIDRPSPSLVWSRWERGAISGPVIRPVVRCRSTAQSSLLLRVT